MKVKAATLMTNYIMSSEKDIENQKINDTNITNPGRPRESQTCERKVNELTLTYTKPMTNL